jgi:hypothetical protein
MKSSHVLSSLFANARVGLVLSSCGFELKIVAASISETKKPVSPPLSTPSRFGTLSGWEP